MAKRIEDSPREQYLELLFGKLRRNEAFLYENAQELYTEIVALGNDAIDHIGSWSRSKAGPQDYVKVAMSYFLIHVLLPISGAIHLNALAGNLPGCYSALRLALESLVKCYLADMRYPELGFIQDKIRSLENSCRKEHKRITTLMGECDEYLGRKGGSAVLWRDLSEMWVHMEGVMQGITNQIVKEADAPAWGIVLPQTYAMGDVHALDELKGRLSQFRSLLRDVLQQTGL